MTAKLLSKLRKLVFPRSFRVCIFLVILVVGLLPSFFMRRAILNTYEKRSVQQRVSNVQNQLMIIGNHLLSNNYFNQKAEEYSSSSREVINAELEMISNLYEGRVMIINSSLRVVKDTYGVSEGKTIISEEVVRCFRGESTWRYDKEHGYIEMTTPIVDNSVSQDPAKDNSQGTIVGVMLTSIANDAIASNLAALNQSASILGNLMLVIILAVALTVSVLLTKPFKRLKNDIDNVSEGYSDKNISVSGYSELVYIVGAFNRLLTRMRALDESRQEFVENVSHELKTPMTSIKVLADSLLSQTDAPAELYREFMEDMASEIDRENRIITDLLALVKMDKKAQGLDIVSLDINELTERILKRLRPIARKKNVEVVFESMRPVTAEVDEVKLTLIMTNLVENAIKYNKEHGWVKVVLDANHQNFTFVVSDSGLGIPEESLSYIYERFYRVDKSHSREIGGTGLGLAITKSAVLMHRGSITVASVEGEGSSFTVKIPLIYQSGGGSAVSDK